ncbi:ABC transporter permease [Streptomyces sp. NPDC059853]|uniref:ABC transporter permease n=1 Tax=Streptomyces sp. NPDC059853 TaxID=3346973 RepID=UPI0036503D44
MNKTLNRWRLGLRVARRDALRAKGRSALVVAMIALPILGVAGADLAVRSSQLSTEEWLSREIGTADARYEIHEAGVPILQHPTDLAELWSSSWDSESRGPDQITRDPGDDGEGDEEPADAFRIEDVLPEGATVLEERSGYADITTEHGILWADIRETDPTAELTRGKYTLLDGDWPTGPGEVAATEQFLKDTGSRVGSEVELAEIDHKVTITGSYELPGSLRSASLLATNDSLLPLLEHGDTDWDVSYLAAVDGGVSWDAVQAANEHGVLVASRAVHLDPPADADVPLFQHPDYYRFDPGIDSGAAALIGVAVALVVLEICLLAGPAFAVGARRSRRQLGLIGSNGGDRAQLRAVMLSSGIVLGAVAAVVGIVLGVIGVVLAKPFLENIGGSRFGSWDFRWLEIAGIAAFAVFIGTLAALIPAINASRSSVLESLTGTKGVRRGSRALPIAGTVALVLGVVIALVGGLSMGNVTMVGLGAVIAELGLVALTPLLVGGFGKLARFLPLSGRLALRDAARNRGRTAPAVAAVLAAAAGAVAVATVTTGIQAQERAEYIPNLPDGTVALTMWDGSESQLDPLRAAAEKTLPVTDRADLATARPAPEFCAPGATGRDDGDCYLTVQIPPENECPLWGESDELLSEQETRELRQDERCRFSAYSGWGMSDAGPVAVGDTDILKVLDLDRPEYRQALEDGKVLVFDRNEIDSEGLVTFEQYESWEQDEPSGTVTLPAHHLDGDGYGLDALMTPETARQAGLGTTFTGTYYATSDRPTSQEEQAFRGELDDLVLGSQTSWTIERGYTADYSLVLLILAIAAMVIALGAAGIATGLAQADSEADLATLAAVGAAPRIRRTLSGLQCGLIAFMGVLLGAVSGLVPAMGLLLADHRERLDWWDQQAAEGWDIGPRPELHLALPWETLGQLVLLVPLIAMLFAAVLTRSRVTLARRAG